MTITKLGHCCLFIVEKDVRILTDPGDQSTLQNDITDLHIILITHEHPDHLHITSLKTVLANNTHAVVITNSSVGKLLAAENIPFTLLEVDQSIVERGIQLAGYGLQHAEMYPSLPRVQNTGYFIADRLFYPGDSFTDPARPIDILALPVSGPWMKLSEALDYALALKPTHCFPVHDGILKSPGTTNVLPPKILSPAGIDFQVLEIGIPQEY